jgi:hypothetical protein
MSTILSPLSVIVTFLQSSLQVSAFFGHHQKLPRYYLVSHSVQVHLYVILGIL